MAFAFRILLGVLPLCFAAAQTDAGAGALIQQLIAAPDAGARANLYSANPSLVNAELTDGLYRAGHAAGNGGNIAGALRIYEIGCEVAERVSYRRGSALCLYNTGMVLLRQNRVDEAEVRFQSAVTALLAVGDHEYAARGLENIALLYRFRGKYTEALQYFDRASSEATLANNPASMANNRFSVGHLYRAMGKYDLAAAAFHKSLEIAQTNKLETQTARSLLGLAGFHYQLNDYALALSFGQQAFAMKDKLGDKLGPAQALETIALAYSNLGQLDKARQTFVAGMQASDDSGDDYIRTMMRFNYSEFLVARGEVPAALAMLDEVIALAKKTQRPSMVAHAQASVAEVANKQSRWQDALAAVTPAIAFARQASELLLIYRASDAAGVAQAALGQNAAAESSFREALAAVETVRDQISADREVVARFMEDKTAIYYHLIELLQRQGRAEEALAIAELSKARVVLDVLVRGNVDFSQSMTAAEKDREAALLKTITERRAAANRGAGTTESLESARLEYRAFKSGLYAAHPELRRRRGDIQPATPAEMMAALPEANTALVQYVAGKQAVFVFVVTAEDGKAVVRSFPLKGERSQLVRDVTRFRELIGSRNMGFRELGATLYQTLLGPVAAQVRNKRTLVIVPDGFLWQVPFQALEQRAGRYLIEDKAVFYAPSFTVLSEMIKTRLDGVQPRVLALGATGLASTRREALGLRDIYGAKNTSVFLDGDADEANVRKDVSTYGVLHLAAHGVFQNRDPMASYLILSKGSLDATAMMSLNLRAGMVVLSGCETGRGDTGPGEGLIGMSWALFVAGSPATVASQWKVDAASTTELMLQFHRGVRASESKARAMQQASLAVMKMPQYRHPFYWSGFVVMGQGF